MILFSESVTARVQAAQTSGALKFGIRAYKYAVLYSDAMVACLLHSWPGH